MERNLTMLTDFYELTMANGYLENGLHEQEAVFDLFFRRVPDNGGFALLAGIDSMVDYLENLRFTEADLTALKHRGLFNDKFLELLAGFQFSCDVWAIPEGTPVFPNEPLVVVKGPVWQAQFVETMLLLSINHQTLIATKSNRMVRAAAGRDVMEFGSRRAHGADAALLGARAAYIGGCVGTSCTLAEHIYDIPALGTMAHSWVQMFPTELEAFRAYARSYPENCTLLVDTYNVIKSGVPNAIKVFREELLPRGCRPKGIRIDSGDMHWLSREARRMLDEAGFSDCRIIASNSLDETIIQDLLNQGAEIDVFGVGERLITARSESVFGGVYKLSAIFQNDQEIPKIKISENVGKITNPGFKNVWRLYDNTTGKAIADVLTLYDEVIESSKPYEIFDPDNTWKRKTLTNFTARPLLEKIFDRGRFSGEKRPLQEIRSYAAQQVQTLWASVLRFENPHHWYVDLSPELWQKKQGLLAKLTSDLTD